MPKNPTQPPVKFHVRFWISDEWRGGNMEARHEFEKDLLKVANKHGLKLASWTRNGKVVEQKFEEDKQT